VTFTATVGADPGRGTPRGSVRFVVDGEDRGAPVTLSAGVAASAPISDLSPGRHTVVAEYTGRSDHLPAMAELFQSVVAASGGGGGGGGGGAGPGDDATTTDTTPATGAPTPSSQSDQGALAPCGARVAITDVRRHGKHVVIKGLTSSEDAGRRVTATVRGRRAGTAWVDDHGRFRVTVPAPRGHRPGHAPLRVTVAGARSPMAVLRPAVRVTRQKARDDGSVRVALRAGKRDGRVELRAGTCAPARSVALHRGHGSVTLPAPDHRIVVYRVYRGERTVAGVPAVAIAPR
jgi:hypothetical protein